MAYLQRGRLRDVFRWLKRAGESHDPNKNWMRIAPREMDKSPNDPKLLASMKKGCVRIISRTMSRYRVTDDRENGPEKRLRA